MKKLFFLLLLIAAKPLMVSAQYDELIILYADENWEKLIRESEKLTLNDKTKSDPMAHLWLSKALYKMSLSGNPDERYKNAYKDAMGALGKAIKLDKDGAVQEKEEKFITEFKSSMVESIGNEMAVPKKALGMVMKYYKIVPNSIGAKYFEGAVKYLDGDKGGANTAWKDAQTKLDAATDVESWSAPDKELLKLGVMLTADCYVKGKQVDKAKAVLGKVAQYFENDEAFKAKYDEIVN